MVVSELGQTALAKIAQVVDEEALMTFFNFMFFYVDFCTHSVIIEP